MKSIFDQETRDEVINRISSLNTGDKATWGKMTVEQMVRHCVLCEEYYMGKIRIRRSLLGRLFGKRVITGILQNSIPILKKNAPTAPHFRVTDNVQDLEAEKEKWKTLIQSYETYTHDNFTHWFFGNMTREQLGQFIYKHCNHHLTQFNR